MAEERAQLRILFNDGSEQRLAFEPRDINPNLQEVRLEKVLSSGQLIIGLDDRLQIIPLSSVKLVEILPKPDVLPTLAVKGAQLLE